MCLHQAEQWPQSEEIALFLVSSLHDNYNDDALFWLWEALCTQLRHIESKGKTGYTKAVMIASSNKQIIFYAHPCFQNQQRYDWVLVQFEEEDCLGVMIDNYYA